jgi:hypothetical protein
MARCKILVAADTAYVSQAMVCLASGYSGDVELHCLCFDTETAGAIWNMGANPIHIGQLEVDFPELLAAKQNRVTREYYVTARVFALRSLLLTQPALPVILCDADIAWRQPVTAVLDRSVSPISLTEHGVERPEGKYNAGIVVVYPTTEGRAFTSWWADRVLEWCEWHVDGDRFAEQGYLTTASQIFGFHTINHPGINLAPWNIGIRNATIDDVICYHFHALLRGDNGFNVGPYPIPEWAIKCLYEPYVRTLDSIEDGLRNSRVPRGRQ